MTLDRIGFALARQLEGQMATNKVDIRVDERERISRDAL